MLIGVGRTQEFESIETVYPQGFAAIRGVDRVRAELGDAQHNQQAWKDGNIDNIDELMNDRAAREASMLAGQRAEANIRQAELRLAATQHEACMAVGKLGSSVLAGLVSAT